MPYGAGRTAKQDMHLTAKINFPDFSVEPRQPAVADCTTKIAKNALVPKPNCIWL